MQWRIWYDDGTTFSDLDGTPAQSPIKHVACIADRVNQQTKSNLAWYYWHTDMGWMGGDECGLLYQALKDPTKLTVVRLGAVNGYAYLDLQYAAFLDRMAQP
jgi:hypothetical protein